MSGDSITGSAPGALSTMSDSYNGSANGNTNYSLSEAGQYAGGVWTMSQFTESETTVTSANYTGSGNFSSSGPSGNESGNYQYTSASSSNFSLYGVGQYANGSFSFQSFSASLAAQAGTTFTESASGPNFTYNRTDATAHSLNLGETGHNQIGNYTLTVTDSDYHSFTETINGATTSYTSSSSISCTTYGTFSLAGGNPFLPYGGNVGQAGGAGVGIQTPWYSRTTGASEGGTNGQGAGSNRVTNSLPRIQGERLEPQWSNQVPMQDEGLPPGTSDDPNLGLPVGPNGTGESAIAPLSFSPEFQNAGKVPALIPPQPSPNNGPYKNSLKSYAEDCFCAGIVSVGYAPYLLGGGGGGILGSDLPSSNYLANADEKKLEGKGEGTDSGSGSAEGYYARRGHVSKHFKNRPGVIFLSDAEGGPWGWDTYLRPRYTDHRMVSMVSSSKELLALLDEYPDGSITSLILAGHGAGETVGIRFKNGEPLTVRDLAKPEWIAILNRVLAKDAKIKILTCTPAKYPGKDPQKLANLLKRTVIVPKPGSRTSWGLFRGLNPPKGFDTYEPEDE
jgi:hypothetical protein